MIDRSVFIAAGAIVLGDVDLGKDVSVWYNAVIRGDTDKISIGAETNIALALSELSAWTMTFCTEPFETIKGLVVFTHFCCFCTHRSTELRIIYILDTLSRRQNAEINGEHSSEAL